ncbi:MAG TPA: hypothetical protein VFR91_07965 [Dyella sp.]|nr:hypothetical protein [Dyella sp.]
MDRILLRVAGLACFGAVSTLAIAGEVAASHWLHFPADAPLRATITLLPKQGDVGRENPVFQGYAPVLAFHPGSDDVSCRLDPGGQDARLDPGATQTVGLDSFEALKVRDDKLRFAVIEGGRKVGVGTLLR